jgi:hypothetical protein
MDGSLAAVKLPSNVAGGLSTKYNADNEETIFKGASHNSDLESASATRIRADPRSRQRNPRAPRFLAVAFGSSATERIPQRTTALILRLVLRSP